MSYLQNWNSQCSMLRMIAPHRSEGHVLRLKCGSVPIHLLRERGVHRVLDGRDRSEARPQLQHQGVLLLQ